MSVGEFVLLYKVDEVVLGVARHCSVTLTMCGLFGVDFTRIL